MIKSVYPVLMTEKIEESRLFYETYFGFIEVFSTDWYISLAHPDGGELALIDCNHESVPGPYRSRAKGMIVNIEVENAAKMYEDVRNRNNGAVVARLRDEDYGQRHFIIKDPNDILVDVIEAIPPGEAFQKNYTGGEI